MHRKTFFLAFVLAGVACGGDDTTGGGAGTTGQAAGTMTQGSGGAGGTSSGGGASGDSTAGSTMAGGASGASVGSGGANGSPDGGGSKCTVMNQNACDTCVFAKCCDAYAACAKDDDCFFGIGALAECVANDPGMVAQCYDDFATTNAMAGALRTCVKTSCDAPCTTVTP